MIEAFIFTLLATILIVCIGAILWLFIIRWDLTDRLGVKNLEYWGRFPDGAAKDRKLAIQYMKAKRSGFPLDDKEYANLSIFVRSDKLRRIMYAVVGLIFASTVGIFGGAILYGLYRNVL